MGSGVKLEFRIPGVAVPQSRPKIVRFGTNVRMRPTPENVSFANKVNLLAAQAIEAFHADRRQQGIEERVFPLTGAVRLTITVGRVVPQGFSKRREALALAGELWPDTRPDVSNYAKIIEDAINETVYKDDGQVVDLRVVKMFMAMPETIVEVESLPEPVEVRVVTVEAKLAAGKARAKEEAERYGHELSKFKTVVAKDDVKAVTATCKRCKQTALVEASAGLAQAMLSGQAVGGEDECG